MKKYLLPLIAVVIVLALIITAFFYRSRPLSPQVKTYLQAVYPLADKEKLNRQFFDSLDFYWYDPKATASFFKHIATQIGPHSASPIVQLSWMAPVAPKNSQSAVVRNRYLAGVSSVMLSGVPSHQLIEVYHNGFYQEPGLYFYALKGTGTFLNVGNTLIARNKVDALQKLGLTDSAILQSDGYFILGGQYLPTFDNIATYADDHGIPFEQALADRMHQSATGSSYAADRFNATASMDYTLYLLAREKGYDTIQLTNQANTNGGWGFEIVDVRSNLSDNLKTRWIKEKQFLFIANPFDLRETKPCELKVPYEMVRCEQILLGSPEESESQ
jgi:hypothetical protein